MNQEDNKKLKQDTSIEVNCPYCRQKTKVTDQDMEEGCAECENCNLLFDNIESNY